MHAVAGNHAGMLQQAAALLINLELACMQEQRTYSKGTQTWPALLPVKVLLKMLPFVLVPNTAPPCCPAELLLNAVRTILPAQDLDSLGQTSLQVVSNGACRCMQRPGSSKRRMRALRRRKERAGGEVLVDGAAIGRAVVGKGAGGDIAGGVALVQRAALVLRLVAGEQAPAHRALRGVLRDRAAQGACIPLTCNTVSTLPLQD